MGRREDAVTSCMAALSGDPDREQPSVSASCYHSWPRQPARAGLPHSPQLRGLGGLASAAFMSCLAGVMTSGLGEATADRWPPEPGAPVCGEHPACCLHHMALMLRVCGLVPISQLREGPRDLPTLGCDISGEVLPPPASRSRSLENRDNPRPTSWASRQDSGG